MFEATRIKLTAWYLLIIMLVSLFFSFAIYFGINQEFNRIEQFEHKRMEEEKRNLDPVFEAFIQEQSMRGLPALGKRMLIKRLDSEMIAQSRTRLITLLGLVNGSIFLLSGVAGYFLAGRTLRPIKHMMDEQNRFITDASHELRTPLTALKSSIEVHLRDKKLTTTQAKQVLKSNLEEVNNLQLLSDNLIQLTHYPKGYQKQFIKVDLESILSESIKRVAPLAKAKHIQITDLVTSIFVYGEKQSLSELFVIILDNAIKYSPPKSTITIESKKIDGKVQISITDEGIGIATKDLPHIYDRFYRADTSRAKKDVSGYGLGLSIAQHLVNLHNGSIQVKSVVDKGTTFTILLPKTS